MFSIVPPLKIVEAWHYTKKEHLVQPLATTTDSHMKRQRCALLLLGLPAASAVRCLDVLEIGSSVVVADMHDGDQKKVQMLTNPMSLRITPHGNHQTWSVLAPLNLTDCTATVDFRVPGKPGPPPCVLKASLRQLLQPSTKNTKPPVAIGFTDPSGTIQKDPTYPLNYWVELGAAIPPL